MARGGGESRTSPAARAAEDQAVAALRRMRQRITPPRQAVIRVLASTDQHLSAAQVAEQAQRVGTDLHLASVYRALETLSRLGLVVHTHLAGGSATYHLTTPASPGRHVHAQCTGCGAVLDVPESWLDELSARMAGELGFALSAHHAALSGRCERCTNRS